MTEKAILQWIKTNLSSYIKTAIEGSDYSEELLGGIAMREMGLKIAKLLGEGKSFQQICENAKGDYSQRKNETAPTYHGFGFWQVDIGSYPNFIIDGDWKDPMKSAKKCVDVLTEKAKELAKSNITSLAANVAAYNCGSGGVRKGIAKANDPDIYTYQHNYSSEVLRFMGIYATLI